MFPLLRNRKPAPHTDEFNASKAYQRFFAARTQLGSFKYNLGRKFCHPLVCAQTQIRTTTRPISGVVQPLQEPHPTRLRRWRYLVDVSLADHSSVSASAFDDDSGEGVITWQKRTSRGAHKEVPARMKCKKHRISSREKLNIETFRERGLIAGRNNKFSLRNCLHGLTLPIPTRPFLIMSRKRKSNSMMKHTRRTRLEIRHNSSQDAVVFSFEDSQHGHAKISVIPGSRLTASFRLIQQIQSNQSPSRYRDRENSDASNSSSGNQSPSLRSNMEYEYKKNSYMLLTRVETSRRAAQLRIATNPLRITPRMQFSLGGKFSSSPYLSWTREPRGGVGEFELGWRGFQISTDWAHPTLSIRKKTPTGGYSAISLNSKRVLRLDQSLVSKPIREGVVLSLNSCMTNQRDMTGASVTATAPWGSVSAHARTSMVCGFSLTTGASRKKRFWHMKVAMENLKTASFRIGVYY